jgi:hypothetical protein
MRLTALTLVLLAALLAAAAALDCRALGFSGFALCSSCDALENAVHDAGAETRCGRSCALRRLRAALAELRARHGRACRGVSPVLRGGRQRRARWAV